MNAVVAEFVPTLLTLLVLAVAGLVLYARECRRLFYRAERFKNRRDEQAEKFRLERGQYRKLINELQNKVTSLEGKLEKARVEEGQNKRIKDLENQLREQKIIRAYGCTKGVSFLTLESAQAYLKTRNDGQTVYRCSVCIAVTGDPIYHMGHRNRNARKTRKLRLAR